MSGARLGAQADKLARFALDVLGAGEDDGGLVFTDSFGEVRLNAHRGHLHREDGGRVETQEALRSLLCRAPGTNSAGLLHGQVLTLFGSIDFAVRLFTRSRYGQEEESFQVLLHRLQPFTHRSGVYTSLRVTAAEKHVSGSVTGLQVGRGGDIQIGYDAPDGLREDCERTEGQVLAALLTERARFAAREQELCRRLEVAAAGVRQAQRAYGEALEAVQTHRGGSSEQEHAGGGDDDSGSPVSNNVCASEAKTAPPRAARVIAP